MSTFDLAIIGSGPAGLTAAVTAAKRGARIVLIDAAADIGGAMHISSGSFSAAGHPWQAARGIVDTPDLHYADCIKISHGTGDKHKLRLWIDNAADTLEWLFQGGLEMGDNMPEINLAHEPYSVARVYTPPEFSRSYLKVLRGRLEEIQASDNPITVMLSSRVKSLLTDDAGGVTGVAVDTENGPVDVHATTVLVASGGYASSPRHWRELHDLPGMNYSNPYSRGDGIELIRQVGGTVVRAEEHLPTIGGTIDIDAPQNCWIQTRTSPYTRNPWEIFVNLNGRRFMDENKLGRDWRERAVVNQPEASFWVVYDERIRREAPAFFFIPEEKVERAFRDHPDYCRADTIEALAAKAGLPAGELRATIERYNCGVAAGSDEMERAHCPLPIAEGPFFAVKHYSTSCVTFAGVLADDNFNVLHADGHAIPNLYAVGEILGQAALGNAFLGGSMVAACMTHARLLGQSTLPW